jgi:hypothetical protein
MYRELTSGRENEWRDGGIYEHINITGQIDFRSSDEISGFFELEISLKASVFNGLVCFIVTFNNTQ